MKKKILRLNEYLNISADSLKEKGIFNRFIGVDAKLFIDPTLLETSNIPEFSNSRDKLMLYYSKIISLLRQSKVEGDLAWKEASRLLKFRELKGLGIGYSHDSDDGNAIGPRLREKLINRAKEIFDLGVADPEIIEMIGLFEEEFGPDRLSDMISRIIAEDIYSYTQNMIRSLDLDHVDKLIISNQSGEKYEVLKHPDKDKPLLFLPESILRALPIAVSWPDIQELDHINESLRRRINSWIGLSWRQELKKDITQGLMEDPQNISNLIEAYRLSEAKPYDFMSDPASQLNWYSIANEFAERYPLKIDSRLPNNSTELKSIVDAIIKQFQRNIENNGLNEHLYLDKAGEYIRNERYAQLLFYAVADTYCNANNIDISREPNAGNGPVDFKISEDYLSKVLVEIKLSTNRNLVKSVRKQLTAYLDAENTTEGIILIIQLRDSTSNIELLQNQHKELQKNETNRKLPQIIVVDGRIKPSASKR